MPMARQNFFFPPQMIERLRKIKEATGIPVSELIRRAIDQLIRQHDQETAQKPQASGMFEKSARA